MATKTQGQEEKGSLSPVSDSSARTGGLMQLLDSYTNLQFLTKPFPKGGYTLDRTNHVLQIYILLLASSKGPDAVRFCTFLELNRQFLLFLTLQVSA